MVRKTSWFGFEYQVWSPKKQLEMGPTYRDKYPVLVAANMAGDLQYSFSQTNAGTQTKTVVSRLAAMLLYKYLDICVTCRNANC